MWVTAEMRESGRLPRDVRRGLWFSLTVDAACELGRDTDRVSTLLTVRPVQNECGTAATSGAASASGPADASGAAAASGAADAGLREDFTGQMTHEQRLPAAQAYLRLTLDHRFRVEAVRQIRPAANDLTGRCMRRDGGVTDIPLLGCGEEARAYLVQMRADPGALPDGDVVRAARADVVTESRASGAAATGTTAGAAAPGAAVRCADPVAVLVLRQPGQDSGPAGGTGTQAEDLAGPPSGSSPADVPDTLTGTLQDREAQPPARPDPAQSVSARAPQPPAGERLVRRVCPAGHLTVGVVVRYCEEPGCGHEFSDDPGRALRPA